MGVTCAFIVIGIEKSKVRYPFPAVRAQRTVRYANFL